MERKWLSLVAIILVHFAICKAAELSCEYSRMTEILHELAANYSSTSKLVSIGTSVEGRELWTMIISDSPNKRPLLRPQVKFVGNVNGMSGPACYILLRLTKHLLQEYNSEASMERKLMESMEIHVIPNMNPDGYAKSVRGSCYGKEGRMNGNDVDLNTDFPDIFNERYHNIFQPETNALMRWMEVNNFVISVSLISGAQVVSYPFDSIPLEEAQVPIQEPCLTPDDDVFKHLALKYAEKTGAPEQGWYCPILKRQFPQGIVNGAEWDPKSGTMMDYNYIQGTFEIMVGISCCRNEDNITALNDLWWRNREGLLHVIHEVEGGIRGQVLDSETYQVIPMAKLRKRLLEHLDEENIWSIPWFTSKEGEFWRPWRPGVYNLRVEREGYKTKDIRVEVHRFQPTFIRVELEKLETTTLSTTSTTSATTKVDFPIESESEDTSFPHSSTEHANHNFLHELPNTKQYSKLTQLEGSIISLFRGVRLKNNGVWIQSSSLNFMMVAVLSLLFFIL